MPKKLVLIVEDLRAQNTWLEIINLVRKCRCPDKEPQLEVRTTAGPLEGYRLCRIVRAQRARRDVLVALAPDTDRYQGSPDRAEETVEAALRRCGKLPSYKIVPVVEKLEDWVIALLEAKICRCCGIEELSNIIGDKYEKHMMANRIPRLLREKAGCKALTNKHLAKDLSLDRLADTVCEEP